MRRPAVSRESHHPQPMHVTACDFLSTYSPARSIPPPGGPREQHSPPLFPPLHRLRLHIEKDNTSSMNTGSENKNHPIRLMRVIWYRQHTTLTSTAQHVRALPIRAPSAFCFSPLLVLCVTPLAEALPRLFEQRSAPPPLSPVFFAPRLALES